MNNFFRLIVGLSRPTKRFIQVFVDVLILAGSFVASMFWRLENTAFLSDNLAWYAITATIPVSILVFIRVGLYRAVVRYISSKAIYVIILGSVASAIALFLVAQLFLLPIPRSVPLIYAVFVFLGVGGIRFFLRALYHRQQIRQKSAVIIYGAGEVGCQLARSLSTSMQYYPVAFVDDARDFHSSEIEGLRIYAPDAIESLIADYNAKTVLLALPNVSRSRRAVIIRRLEALAVHVQTVPSFTDLVTGRSTLTDITEVEIADLLGRDPVLPNEALFRSTIIGQVVMVTGAGGSIGSELCRQILECGPRALILYEMSEIALYSIEKELSQQAQKNAVQTEIFAILGSLHEQKAISAIILRYHVNIIYHAAAYKHVPIVEDNVVQGVRNNIFGTYNLALAAIESGVSKFILISTDKAVRPTNIMGATKRIAELICQSLAESQAKTIFSMVRFGNVLGSSGSVVPVFRKQIAAGGPITVTHPEVTRYFMTIPEAAQLVIQSAAMSKGGDVFHLDMGGPIKIVDLAMQMARLSGLTPFIRGEQDDANVETVGDIEVKFTGLRPGEKLYEELLIGEGGILTEHPQIIRAHEVKLSIRDLHEMLFELERACDDFDVAAIKQVMLCNAIGYSNTVS